MTDANVVLGRIGARTLLGGRLELDPQLAAQTIEERVARPLGLDVVAAAAGIVRICVAGMAGAIRALTAERGADPRDYTILAGGGGPLHAAAANEFGIGEVIVPAHPGLLSAGGLALSDLRIDRLRSYPIRVERDGVEDLRLTAADLLAQVVAELEREGYEGIPLTAVSLDMKYTGQNWDITVPLSLEDLTEEEVARRFDRRHDELYGFALPEHTHEVLALRASAVGPIPEPERLVPRRFFEGPRRTGEAQPAETRPVWDDRAAASVDGRILRWDDLRPADRLTGPLVVEGMDSTVWIPSNAVAVVGETGEIVLSLGVEEA